MFAEMMADVKNEDEKEQLHSQINQTWMTLEQQYEDSAIAPERLDTETRPGAAGGIFEQDSHLTLDLLS